MKRTKIFSLIAELIIVIGTFTGYGEVKNPSMSTIVKNAKETEIVVNDKTFAEEVASAEIEKVEPTSVDIEEARVEEAEPTFVESAPVEIDEVEIEKIEIEEAETVEALIEETDVEEVQPAQTVPTTAPVVTEPAQTAPVVTEPTPVQIETVTAQTVEPTPAQIEVAEPMQTTPVISEPEPTPVPVHMHDWKEHVVTTQTWIPNIVVMDDYETKIVESYLFICYCDFETNDADVIQQHVEDHIDANEIELAGFGIQDHSYREQIKVGSHEEDHGYYETSTYVDYYYCDCGATR